MLIIKNQNNMLFGALIGLIIAIISIYLKKLRDKKALEQLTNNNLIDTPEYAAYFHYANEKTYLSKGFKFFNSNGVLYITGKTIFYKPQKGNETLDFDIDTCKISLAAEKKNMKWVCIEKNGTKHYFTSFSQSFFKLDKTEMDNFLKQLNGVHLANY